ncbi:MAG: SagB/ThcOx family dehydrogenase [Bacteroidales bacterium]|nr:SagB/ThcOx family dehydrogenase [Bacteroidales bacterium]
MKRYVLTLMVVFVGIGLYAQVQETANAIETQSKTMAFDNINKTNELIIELGDVETSGGLPLMEALRERKSNRNISPSEIDFQLLAKLLWAACGVNRPAENKKTVPSARNVQEIEIYAFMENGIWHYNPIAKQLHLTKAGDHRKSVSRLEFVGAAPVVLVLVANYDKMKDFSAEDKVFYSSIDCGYVGQNIYLFAASENLATVTIGQVNREAVAKLIGLKNGKVMIAHPIGYAK